jgi:hypothetical protein
VGQGDGRKRSAQRRREGRPEGQREGESERMRRSVTLRPPGSARRSSAAGNVAPTLARKSGCVCGNRALGVVLGVGVSLVRRDAEGYLPRPPHKSCFFGAPASPPPKSPTPTLAACISEQLSWDRHQRESHYLPTRLPRGDLGHLGLPSPGQRAARLAWGRDLVSENGEEGNEEGRCAHTLIYMMWSSHTETLTCADTPHHFKGFLPPRPHRAHSPR